MPLALLSIALVTVIWPSAMLPPDALMSTTRAREWSCIACGGLMTFARAFDGLGDCENDVTKIPDLPPRGRLAALARLPEAGWLGISVSPRGPS